MPHIKMYPATITMIDYTRPLAERAKARKSVGPYTWTPTQRGKPNGRNEPFAGRGFYQSSKGLSVDARGSTFDLRLDYARNHLGYQRRGTGPFSHEMISGEYDGIVARLPHGRGFLAGYTLGNGMCASLDGHIWDAIEDAARYAIDMAREACDADIEYAYAEMEGDELE